MMRSGLTAALAAIALALAGAPAHAADLAKMTPGELTAFTTAMPKGGELHNHFSGALFGENLMTWAVQDGACVNTQTWAVLQAPCQVGGDVVPAAKVAADPALYAQVLDSSSTRHPGFMGRSGHDQFFGTFQRFDVPNKHVGEALALILDDLARQNTFYLELMINPRVPNMRAVVQSVTWRDDLPAMKAALDAAGLQALVPQAIANMDAVEAQARAAMACGTPKAHPGCLVTVRYLTQAVRAAPPQATLGLLELGAALVAADHRWVGLQLVAPEDEASAIANYDLQMRMLDFVSDHGRKVPVALHAGELSLDVATPADLRDHVAKAVRVAGARRIGHGTDIAHEEGAEALAAEMAAKGVLVEVNLTSNAVILGVSEKDHPYGWLRQRGVPVSLSTDDAGVLRIDLAHEYQRAAAYGATYDDLKRSARNALAFSFLSGEGLWLDPNAYRKPTPACAGQIGQAAPKPGACADLIARSDKAREQWRHERLLAQFENAARP